MSSKHMDNIVRIYDSYFTSLNEQISEQSISDGLMGMGRKEDSLPCHDKFYTSLSAELTAFTDSSPCDTEVESIVKYILEAPLLHTEPKSAYWMMLAAHSLTEGLIAALSDEAAERLAAWYGKAYPRHERLPAQKKLLKMMQRSGRKR